MKDNFLITIKTVRGYYLIFFSDLEHLKDGSFLLLANNGADLAQILEKRELQLLIPVSISCKEWGE